MCRPPMRELMIFFIIYFFSLTTPGFRLMGAARLDGMVYGDGWWRETGKRGKEAKKGKKKGAESRGGNVGFFFCVVLVRERGGLLELVIEGIELKRERAECRGLREILAGEEILCFYRYFCLKNLGTNTAILSFLVIHCFCFRLLLFLSALYCLEWIL